jgi:hypothetical protein
MTLKPIISTVIFLEAMSVFFGLNADASKRNRQVIAQTNEITTGEQDRKIWTDALYKIAWPVIHNLAENTLHKNMPVEAPKENTMAPTVTYLEA